jgi:hypothetical protein
MSKKAIILLIYCGHKLLNLISACVLFYVPFKLHLKLTSSPVTLELLLTDTVQHICEIRLFYCLISINLVHSDVSNYSIEW